MFLSRCADNCEAKYRWPARCVCQPSSLKELHRVAVATAGRIHDDLVTPRHPAAQVDWFCGGGASGDLPWVRIDTQYRFETDEGSASLTDLFRGRSQVVVYHFMFGPDYTAGCPACSAIADGFNGFTVHLANHDVMFWAVSRAPLTKLQTYKRRMGWTFGWASSFGSDFNFDFNVSVTEDQQRDGVEYNHQREAPVAKSRRFDAADLPLTALR